MELVDILPEGSIISCAKVSSKRQLLQKLANKAQEDIGLDSAMVFDRLVEREQLGSTGLGNGIAIPHGKIENISKVCAVFARLEKPIDFDAIDDRPVDLVIMLLAPIGAGADHLKALAKVARLFRTEHIVDQLRQTSDMSKLHEILIGPIEKINAA